MTKRLHVTRSKALIAIAALIGRRRGRCGHRRPGGSGRPSPSTGADSAQHDRLAGRGAAGRAGGRRVDRPVSEPPFGKGSLGLEVADKATITRRGEGVLRQRGRLLRRPAALGQRGRLPGLPDGREHELRRAANLPGITFEIDPNMTGPAEQLTSLVWAAGAVATLTSGARTSTRRRTALVPDRLRRRRDGLQPDARCARSRRS